MAGVSLVPAAPEDKEAASRPKAQLQTVPRQQAELMTNFFQAQMDYIFFFYGLAFIGLGVVAYVLSQGVNQRLPWGWLALFGFTHGVNEWLDLLALVWGDALWFGALRWVTLTTSFLCLVEFGRLSLTQRWGRGPGRWLLIVLGLGAVLGALDGWSGLNATTRYCLGLVASLGAGWALLAEAQQTDSQCSPSLVAGGFGFILYGLATGLVVPQAGFFPANTINYTTFTSLTGLPIQLVRGLLAVGIAAVSVGYFQVAQSADSQQRYRYRAYYLYVVVAALVIILAGGWVMTQSLGNAAWQQLRKDSLSHNQLAIQRLTFEIKEAEEAVRAMSGSPWIGPALRSASPQTLAQANSVLDRYQQRFGATVTYLLDTSGTTIATSNRGAPDSFAGHNYAFRPYFQAAMQGKPARYLALGVTSKQRGFYVSHPVVDPAGKVIGVTVFKMTLNRFQQELKEFDPAFLIDPQGIVFVASRPDLDYRSLWPLTVAEPASLKAQYGTDHFTPIFPHPLHNENLVDFAGKRYVATRQNITSEIAPGWVLINLEPFTPVIHYRLMGIFAAFILVVLTLVFAGINLSIREGANRIRASEARFRTMFAAAPEAVFVYDPLTRRIVGANPFMAHWLGYSREELIGLDIDQVRDLDSQRLQGERTGEDLIGPPLLPSLRYRKRDGSLVDVECTEANITYGDQARKIVFVRDITARRQAENEVRQAKDYLENILENSADPIGIVNQRGRIIKWNKAAERAFGYSFQELDGFPAFDLYADRTQLQKMLSQLRLNGSVNGFEILMNKRDGSVGLFALSINLLYDRHRKTIGSVCVARGLSEIKKALNDLAVVNEQLQHEIAERQQAQVELAWDARVNASIADLSRALLNSMPLEEIAGLVHQHAKSLTDSSQAFCGYINPQTGALVLPSIGQEACGVKAETVVFHKFSGLWGWVLENSQPLLTNNPSEDPRAAGTPPGHFPVTRFLSVPALIDGKLVGQIGLANAPRDYTARDQELCERLSRLFAMAIHRHRMDETLKESETGLKTILDNVQTGVLIIEPETHVIVDANPVAVALIGAPKEEIIGSECSCFICRPEHGKCAVTDLGENVVNAERELLRADGSTRWVMQTVVRISLQGKERLLESYVDITERRQGEEAIQITNDKLHILVAQIEERNRTMTLANQMSDMLQVCHASDEAYKAIGHVMPRVFPNDAGALYMLDKTRNLFESVVSWGQDQTAIPIFAPDECWSVRRGRLHKVENPQENFCCPHITEAVHGGYLCLPLIAQGETLGVLHLRPGPPAAAQTPELTDVKEQLALTMADKLALALANLKLRETLRNQAIRDPLTGLFNRRYLEETIKRELNRIKRHKVPLVVIMMDLDHFKQYNDNFGHSAGDDLLSALGTLLQSHIRGEDIACRYGGEEFMLIMPGASIAIALERAESLRLAVKEMHLHHPGLKPTSLSLGVAVYPEHGDTGLQLIQAADAALYRAKKAGRDRVIEAEYDGAPLAAAPPASPVHLTRIS